MQDIALKKNQRNLENQLFDHLLWREITNHFTLRERGALEVFGERYGSEALRQKVLGLLGGRLSKPQLTKFILQAKKEAKYYAQRMMLAQRNNTKTHVVAATKELSDQGQEKKKQAAQLRFRKKMLEVSKPLLQAFISLGFFHRILQTYFSEAEQASWIKRFNDKSDTEVLASFIATVEAKAGKSLSELMDSVTQEAERRVLSIIVGSVEEYRAIEKKGLDKPMLEALEKKNWPDLLKHYQALSH